jgi:hypothetical protein
MQITKQVGDDAGAVVVGVARVGVGRADEGGAEDRVVPPEGA